MSTAHKGEVIAGGKRLETLWIDPAERGGTTIVMLHEGLGSVALWKDFPERLAADGGFIVSASTSGPRGPRLQSGHFVAWQAQRYDPQVAKDAPPVHKRFGLFGLKDKRIGWVGLIAGTLKLEYRDGGWVGDERFSS